ncbi:MAG TPA: glycerate kinase [Actinocrinis sp.]|jgi:glycerate kinase|uniref:glycerate kinase n=1 Tax=Actinocrinis sp. TaxID=1920516 RepID=UPI002DDDBD14|nr:glycerate kinase [Actinocrinis sp.]HEV3168860.1 glycerate kinase [Actinocrinis sp.]
MGTPTAAEATTQHVLIAPDKFKGSATAAEVAESVAVGIRRVAPDVPLAVLPVADGGDGTVDAAVAAGFERREVTVTGPLGGQVVGSFALRSGTAVVEMAQASGLVRLPGGRLAPLTAGTRGTGELVLAALRASAGTIVLGVGGSATTDGGVGMLAALGARFLDADGRELPDGGGALRDLASVDLTGLDPRLADTEFILASDVDNPLLGPHGAAAVYSPQKGATPEDVVRLEAGLARLADALARTLGPEASRAPDAPGAGAAGGMGYGAMAVLHAHREPGIAILLDVLGFDKALIGARLVITGEGALDEQTLHGKAPAGVANAARARSIPVVAVCGRLLLDPARLAEAGFAAAYALTDIEPDVALCIAEPRPILESLGELIARDHLLHLPRS